MRSITIASGVLVLVVAGCGGGSAGSAGGGGGGDEDGAVRDVMADLQSASREGDGNRICNQLFTPKLADSVTSASRTGSCAKEVRQKLFSPKAKITVESVEVSDPANAKATIKEQSGKTSNVFLVKQSGEWRVRSVQPA